MSGPDPDAAGRTERRGAELRVPPPIVAALAAAAMFGLAQALPAWGWALPARGTWATALALAGVALALAGVLVFRRAGTTIDPTRPERSAALVRGGPFRFTRNPMYLGMLLALLGWAAWLSNLAALAPVVGFVAWIDRFQIRPEERVLARRFGAEFDAYRAAVRRWL